jgi:hypothetical protein
MTNALPRGRYFCSAKSTQKRCATNPSSARPRFSRRLVQGFCRRRSNAPSGARTGPSPSPPRGGAPRHGREKFSRSAERGSNALGGDGVAPVSPQRTSSVVSEALERNDARPGACGCGGRALETFWLLFGGAKSDEEIAESRQTTIEARFPFSPHRLVIDALFPL